MHGHIYMYVCILIYNYMDTYTCMYAFVKCVCMYIHNVYMSAYIHAYICINIYSYMHACIYIQTKIYLPIYIPKYMHICMPVIYTCIHTHLCMQAFNVYVGTYIHICLNTYVYA